MPDNTIEKLDIQITSSAAGASKALDALASRLGKLNEITKQLGDMSQAGINKLSKLADAVNKLGSTDASKLSRTINALGKLNKAGTGALNPTEALSPGGEEVDVTPDTSKNASKLVSVLTYLRQRLADVRVGASEASKAMNNGFSGRLGRRIRSLFEYRIIKAFFNAITSGIREGINNVYQWSKSFNGIFSKSMDKISTAGLYLKNSIGAALTSLINMAAPILDKLVDMVVSVINVINQLIAMITGASIWTKAKKYPKEYANAVSGAAKQISKSLAPFDEINNIGNSTAGGSGGTGSNLSGMFEEMELSDKFKMFQDMIRANAEQLMLIGIGAMFGIGVALLFMGHPVIGLGLILASGVLAYKEVFEKWDYVKEKVGGALNAIVLLASGAMLGIGTVLLLTGHVGIGLGMILAGITAAAIALDWSFLPTEIQKKLAEIMDIIGKSSMVIGAILAFSGVNIPLGIAMMAGGYGLVHTASGLKWSAITDELGKAIKNADRTAGVELSSLDHTFKSHFDGMKSSTDKSLDDMQSSVGSKLRNIRSAGSSNMQMMNSDVNGSFNSIFQNGTRTMSQFSSNVTKSAGSANTNVTNSMNNMSKNVDKSLGDVENRWNSIKLGKWDIKLPHFSISTGSYGLPHINIDWYEKGGLFSGPQIIGVGEYAGADSNPEVVAPLETLKGMLGSSNDETNDILEKILEVLETKNYSPVLNVQEVGKAIAKYNKDQGRILGVRPI